MDSDHFYLLEDQVVAQRQRSLEAMIALQEAQEAVKRCDYELQWVDEGAERCLVRTAGGRRIIIPPGQGRDLESMHAKHLQKRQLAQLGLQNAQAAYANAAPGCSQEKVEPVGMRRGDDGLEISFQGSFLASLCAQESWASSFSLPVASAQR